MVFIPQELFKTILDFCDDSIEQKQRVNHKMMMKQMWWFSKDWFSKYIDQNEQFGETTEERYQYMVEWEEGSRMIEMIEIILEYDVDFGECDDIVDVIGALENLLATHKTGWT